VFGRARIEPFRAAEVADDEKPRILEAYLARPRQRSSPRPAARRLPDPLGVPARSDETERQPAALLGTQQKRTRRRVFPFGVLDQRSGPVASREPPYWAQSLAVREPADPVLKRGGWSQNPRQQDTETMISLDIAIDDPDVLGVTVCQK
jgi:hypothetical protein